MSCYVVRLDLRVFPFGAIVIQIILKKQFGRTVFLVPLLGGVVRCMLSLSLIHI